MAKTLDATPACLREDPCGGDRTRDERLRSSAELALDQLRARLQKRLEIASARHRVLHKALQTLDPDWLAEDHPHPRVRRLAALEARAENAATSLEDRCDEIFKALVILDEIGQATYHQRRELLLARRKRFQGKA